MTEGYIIYVPNKGYWTSKRFSGNQIDAYVYKTYNKAVSIGNTLAIRYAIFRVKFDILEIMEVTN